MDRIEHSGVVKRVDAERVCVEITALSPEIRITEMPPAA